MKKYWFLPILTAVMLGLCGCSGSSDSSSQADSQDAAVESQTDAAADADAEAEEVTEPETEPETEAPTQAPFPDADPNAWTFDNGDCSFVSVVVDTKDSAEGEMTVEDVDGNMMLRFNDASTTADTKGDYVQKMLFDVTAMLAPEQLTNVNSVSFDIYGIAREAEFVDENGEKLLVPGNIQGGGGSICADGKWFGFSDFTATNINEYNLERSDAYRVEFKFLLAASGKKWEPDMEECTLQIMRWGIQNITDTYIDNITFYDADGNSIPVLAE